MSHKITAAIGDKQITIETGKLAKQADGAVTVQLGETIVLVAAVAATKAKEGQDFFPLTVNYQEKTFAAGKIPGGFFKREGRPTEKEVLTSRLIDRPIRPLFAHGFRNETQVVCTVLSHDLENDPDIVAMVGTSAALTLSGVPFLGPIGATIYLFVEALPDIGLVGHSFKGFSRRKRIGQLQLAIRDNPSTGNYEELGDLLLEEGKLQPARDAYDRAVAARASTIGPFYGRGLCAIRLGDAAAALPDLERVVDEDPGHDFYRAAGLLAHAYALTGQKERAEALFRRATTASKPS